MNIIKLKIYNLQNLLLTNELIFSIISNFWEDIFTPLVTTSGPKHLLLLCKVHFTEEAMGYRTLGHLVKINYEDKDLFINYLQERLGTFVDAYTSMPINSMHFSYIIKDGPIVGDNRVLFNDITDKPVSTHLFNNKKIPISMDPEDYGSILVHNEINDITRYIVSDGIRTYQIDTNRDGSENIVKILGGSLLMWKDTKIADSGIKREIGKSTIYFLDGEIILQKQERPAKAFAVRPQKEKINNNLKK